MLKNSPTECIELSYKETTISTTNKCFIILSNDQFDQEAYHLNTFQKF